jgi:hypothetical protein
MLCNEGSFQAYWLDGCRSDPVAGSTRGRDLDFAEDADGGSPSSIEIFGFYWILKNFPASFPYCEKGQPVPGTGSARTRSEPRWRV